MKEYLSFEAGRNRTHAAMYERLVKAAYGGARVATMTGHHVAFELDGNIATENEIPSADTLLFDHTIMRATFGAQAIFVMQRLAEEPAERRDALLQEILQDHDNAKADPARSEGYAAVTFPRERRPYRGILGELSPDGISVLSSEV